MMDSYGTKKNFWSFLEEAKRAPQSPNQHHHLPHTQPSSKPPCSDTVELPRFSLSRLSSATVASLSPSSPGAPGSPWSFSPLRRSQSPSFLYHCLASLKRQDGNVYSISISRGLVFTGSESDRVRVWKQPDCVDRSFIRTGRSRVLCILAHGSTLFTTHKDHRVRVWTVSLESDGRLRSKKLATLPPSSMLVLPFGLGKSSQHHRDVISCLALHQAEGILYTGSCDWMVKAWRLAEKACVDSFVAHDGPVTAMVINQLDGCLFTASTDGAIKVWRRIMYGDNKHALTMVLRFQYSPVNALVLSHGRQSCFLYAGSSDGYVNIWEKEAAAGRYNHGGFLQGHRYAVLCLAAVERMLLSGSEDTTIRVWRRDEEMGLHTCLAVMEGHRGPVRCMAVSLEIERGEVAGGGTTELLLYSASLDRVVKVWRIKVVVGGKEQEEVSGGDGGGSGGGVGGGGGGGAEEELDVGMSPVLSPKWVEKKLQRTLLF